MITQAGAEPGRDRDVLPVTQADREDAVETLQRTAGDGRLPGALRARGRGEATELVGLVPAYSRW
jgi:hypothetical protein